jgi:hypothetical protein
MIIKLNEIQKLQLNIDLTKQNMHLFLIHRFRIIQALWMGFNLKLILI